MAVYNPLAYNRQLILHNVFTNIIMTIVLLLTRRQQDTTKNRHHLLTYLLPILLFAVLFNITKFFESKVPSCLWTLCFSSIKLSLPLSLPLSPFFLVLIVLHEKVDFSVIAIISASESFLREERKYFLIFGKFSKLLAKGFHCGNLL